MVIHHSKRETREVVDNPWAEMVDLYFPQFMQFFFPDIYAKIDWDEGYEHLDQELREVALDATTGKRGVDRLIRVRTLAGHQLHIFIHLKIKNNHNDFLPLRMFTYYRFFERYNEAVASLALLGDDGPENRSDGLWSHQIAYTAEPVKLWDYYDRWEDLKVDPNPFATVVMAHLKACDTCGDEARRLEWKIQLVRRLYEGCYDEQQVLALFRFIDQVLQIPAELEEQFLKTVDHLKENLRIP